MRVSILAFATLAVAAPLAQQQQYQPQQYQGYAPVAVAKPDPSGWEGLLSFPGQLIGGLIALPGNLLGGIVGGTVSGAVGGIANGVSGGVSGFFPAQSGPVVAQVVAPQY